jgi:ATP-dependent RNA helicase DDX24/MAK5
VYLVAYKQTYHRHSSQRLEDTDIPEMSIELNLLDKLKVHIQLARKIDSAQHKIKKDNHERNWMKEAAEAMEIELDSDIMR